MTTAQGMGGTGFRDQCVQVETHVAADTLSCCAARPYPASPMWQWSCAAPLCRGLASLEAVDSTSFPPCLAFAVEDVLAARGVGAQPMIIGSLMTASGGWLTVAADQVTGSCEWLGLCGWPPAGGGRLGTSRRAFLGGQDERQGGAFSLP